MNPTLGSVLLASVMVPSLVHFANLSGRSKIVSIACVSNG
jgi:hypothetical protein